MFVLLCRPNTGEPLRLKVMRLCPKIYSVCAWRGQVPISCPCVRVCWGKHMRVKIACRFSPVSVVDVSRCCWRVIPGLMKVPDLIYGVMHIGLGDNDGLRQMYHMQTCTYAHKSSGTIVSVCSESIKGVGRLPSASFLSGHHVPLLDEKSPVLGGWMETERGFFVLCNYTIVLAPSLNSN